MLLKDIKYLFIDAGPAYQTDIIEFEAHIATRAASPPAITPFIAALGHASYDTGDGSHRYLEAEGRCNQRQTRDSSDWHSLQWAEAHQRLTMKKGGIESGALSGAVGCDQTN